MMKKNALGLAIGTVLLMLLSSGNASAQESAVREVERATTDLIEAMLKADGAMLDSLSSNELTYGHSSGKVEDKASFIQTLVSGESVFEEIVLTEQQVQVVDHTGIVRHGLTAKTNDPGKGPADIKLGIVLTWVKTDGSWKLLARQAFKLPDAA